jgi:hypothetical protein
MLLKYDVELTQESRSHSFAIRKRGAFTLHLAADTNEAMIHWSTIIREAVERNNKVIIFYIRYFQKIYNTLFTL